MRRRLDLTVRLGLVLAAVAVLGTTRPVSAQIAAALGKPLPSPDLPIGTVSVRIVAGTGAAPVIGTDVTLLVNGAPRVARTDSAGRATFAGLAVGATVIAKVVDADKAEHASSSFPIPDSGGTRVMITTKPWQGGAGAPSGGGPGMPNPRQMSGEARPDQADPSGTMTIRVAYDDFKDTPEGVAVALVGFAADNSVSYQMVKTDKSGRAQFVDLDRSSGTSYFAMTSLPRNGSVDRLTSGHTELGGQVGLRMMLSSEKRDSQAPPIDDLNQADVQTPTPAGQVRVVLEGIADLSAKVTLIDAATQKPIGEATPEVTPPDPSRVDATSQFEPDAKLPPGTLDVEVTGGAGQDAAPLKDVEVRVMPADSKDPSDGVRSLTGADGKLRLALPAKQAHKAVFTINGRPFVSRPLDLAASGGKVVVRASWEEVGRPAATIPTVGAVAGQAVYAECAAKGERYRSMPFQLLDHTGTKISIYVYPRTLFGFQLHSYVEDSLFATQGRIEITNYSWAPYRAGPEGLLIPLPKGFKGGVVYGDDQQHVAVVPDEGFRVIHPIPPGGRKFHGGFSLDIDGGTAQWSLDLPLGTVQSQLDVRLTPGMAVTPAGRVSGTIQPTPKGTYYWMESITIPRGSSMQMSITGMPSPPGWDRWLKVTIGVLVVGTMLAGVGVAVLRKPEQAVAVDARRQRLLDELVELERTGGSAKRREQVLRELEEIWT